jgi:hypothetical protein
LLIRKNKQKYRPPTEEEFFQYVPIRAELEWSINEEGLVEIKTPKFASNFGKSFCKVIKKDNTFTAKMDKIGSIVWKNCDGKNSVKDILEKLKKELPKEGNINQRLFLFLQQMNSLHYIFLTIKLIS